MMAGPATAYCLSRAHDAMRSPEESARSPRLPASEMVRMARRSAMGQEDKLVKGRGAALHGVTLQMWQHPHATDPGIMSGAAKSHSTGFCPRSPASAARHEA